MCRLIVCQKVRGGMLPRSFDTRAMDIDRYHSCVQGKLDFLSQMADELAMN